MKDFDLVVACGLLHHLSDAAARRAIAFCHDRLRNGGRLITLDCAIEDHQPVLSRLLVACDRGRFVRSGQGYLELARERFESVSIIRGNLLRVPYAHVMLRCEKR